MRRTSEYEVTVHPDGSWRVELRTCCGERCTTNGVASGAAEDQRRGEMAARWAIEDDKAARAKEQVEASMVQHFTVPA